MNYLYQSNGACKTQCQGNYAFGIVQDKNCWCSNYVPGNLVPASYCNATCPGYPDDLCGNLANGYFGYIAVGRSPSGTIGLSSSTTSTSTSTLVSTNAASRTTTSGLHAQQSPLVLLIQARQFNDDDSTTTTSTSSFTRTFFGRTTSSSSTTTLPPPSSTQTSSTTAFSPTILTDSFQAPPSSTPSSTTQLLTSSVSLPTPQPVTQSQDATTVVSYVTLVSCVLSFSLAWLTCCSFVLSRASNR